MDIDVAKLKSGDRRQLAKAITLIESKSSQHQAQSRELLQDILPFTGKSFRIGISGSPGVGKSTFIEALGLHLTQNLKRRVAVLAIDPTSPLTGGSILGDKTRMTKLSNESLAFIRPSPSGKYHGGIALKTREAMLLCEAAGFNTIIIETVGVGQAEYEVASMVDFFQILVLPNSGDELQGIKKGILELVHAIVINKADGANIDEAKKTLHQYQSACHLLSSKSNIQVFTASALNHTHIDTIWNYAFHLYEKLIQSNDLAKIRAQQNKAWLEKIVHELLNDLLFHQKDNQQYWKELEDKVANANLDPYQAALSFLKQAKITLPPA